MTGTVAKVIGTIANIFRIQDLRNKILFTVGLLVIYRIGFHIPIPGFDYQAVERMASQRSADAGSGQDSDDSRTPMERAMDYLEIFSGGTLSQSSLFGLGIMPYITASIILMLLGEVVPSLKKLRQEGQTGYKKIQEYTRYLTVLVCVIQALMYMQMLMRGEQLIYPGMEKVAIFLAVVAMTAGTVFLMWLGEQIDEYGIGNGISLIIMAGIVVRMPKVVLRVVDPTSNIGPAGMVILVVLFVLVIAGAILVTQAQRRIPIQQAKQMRGRRMYGGARHYLPLRVNHGGVMPIIFASSFMMFPPIIMQYIVGAFRTPPAFLVRIQQAMDPSAYSYNILYVVLIFVFAYFWVTVQFQPKEMAKNLRDSGSFIPGLRPGRRTADYLETVMTRITYYGAAFLAAISMVPVVASHWINDWQITTCLGGTGLLIVVSVSLDLVQKIEANLLMRSYDGFTSSGRIKGAYA